MPVYLLRHGDALSSSSDALRALSPKGKAEAEAVGRFLKTQNVKVDAIFHSRLLRAKQTAEIVSGFLPPCPIVEKDCLAPEDSVLAVYNEIIHSSQSILIAGHLPFLSRLASRLLWAGEEKDVFSFKKGAVLALEKDGGNWHVRFFLVPDAS